MTRKVDVGLAHRQKLCSGKKDQVAQLKVDMLKKIADQARNDVMGYKTSQYQILGVMPEGKSE